MSDVCLREIRVQMAIESCVEMTIQLKKTQEEKPWGALKGDHSERAQGFRGEVGQ